MQTTVCPWEENMNTPLTLLYRTYLVIDFLATYWETLKVDGLYTHHDDAC
jgi:hypothetical protein